MILRSIHLPARCRFACWAGLLCLASGLPAACGQPRDRDLTVASDPDSARNVLIDRAADALQIPRGIVAKVRLRGELFRQHLVGTGTYQQFNVDDSQLLKVDLKLSLHGNVASFQRINDGRSIWVRTDLPTEDGQWESRVERMDLAQWQRATSNLESPIVPWGDLGHLLTQLQVAYAFDGPQTMNHHGFAAWLLSGRRRTPAAENSSESSPNEVVLVLGKDDLFPYLIEFRRRDSAAAGTEARQFVVSGGAQTLLTIEFFEVAFPSQLPRDTFRFRAGEIPVRELPP